MTEGWQITVEKRTFISTAFDGSSVTIACMCFPGCFCEFNCDDHPAVCLLQQQKKTHPAWPTPAANHSYFWQSFWCKSNTSKRLESSLNMMQCTCTRCCHQICSNTSLAACQFLCQIHQAACAPMWHHLSRGVHQQCCQLHHVLVIKLFLCAACALA